MAFNRPSDIAVIVGIFGLVIITVGYLLTSVTENTSLTADTTFVTQTQGKLIGEEGLQGNAIEVGAGLNQTTGQDVTDSSVGIGALDSVLSLGRSVSNAANLTESAADKLMIPNEFSTVIIGIIIITFAVIVYSWFKGATI